MSLRVAQTTDAAAIRSIYAPWVRDSAVSFETEVPSVETMAQRIATLLPMHPWIVAVANEESGAREIVGYAYASPHRERAAYRWSVELTAYVDATQHRRGIGAELYRGICALLVAQRIVNAFGIITLPNDASAALHESCGFTHCATLARAGYKSGAWHDVGWWQKSLCEPTLAPAEPRPFAELSSSTLAIALDRR
ncbi:MAG: N-acetyltransferase family protein [Rudaea sp.]